MFTSEAVRKLDGKASERRSCSRATLQWVVLVFFGQDHWGKLIDLSEKGMCFQFEHPPALREPVNFTFEAMGCTAIPHEGRQGKVFGDSIQASGRVIWTRDFERIAGVQFLDLSPRSRDQIRYWISSGAAQEAAPLGEQLNEKWKKAWSKGTVREVPAPFLPVRPPVAVAPVKPAAFTDKTPSSHVEELFGNDLGNSESDVEVVWKPEPSLASPDLNHPLTSEEVWPQEPEPKDSFAPPALDEPVTSGKIWPAEAEPEDSVTSPDLEEPVNRRRKWLKVPERVWEPANLDEQTTFSGKWPGEAEPDSSATSPSLDRPVPGRRKWPLESKPEPALDQDELGSVDPDNHRFWARKPALASQGVEPLGFDVPGVLPHDERHRRGQTLELRQRRARVGFIAVLCFLATGGALAGIIGFTSKFNDRPEVSEGVPHSLEGKGVSNQEDGSTSEATTPFLVEVLEANNRRSVLLFSGASHSNQPARRPAQNPSFVPEASAVSLRAPREEPREEPRQENTAAATKREPFHDFTFVSPHASDSGTTPRSALEAPAISGDAPAAALAAPLRESLPAPAVPAPVEAALPRSSDFQPARLIRAMLPPYPPMARINHVAGDVTLDALVDETGNVRDVKIISGPLLLREAAKEALREWKYVPARLDGRETAMHLTVTVKFQDKQANR
jgi:TonB family protein